MIVLDTTTDNLQIVLNAAITTNQLQCVSSWRDITTTGYTPGRTVTNTNSTTDVNLVAAPAASTQRVIDTVSIYNNDTVIAQVIIKFDANGTEYILKKVALAPAERLEYSEKKGRRVLNRIGSIKTAVISSLSNNSTARSAVVTTYDQVNSNVTADTIYPIVGLGFGVEKGKTYYFRAVISYNSASLTTGMRLIFDTPFYSSSGGIVIRAVSVNTLSASTEGRWTNAFAATNGVGTQVASTAGANFVILEGFITGATDIQYNAYFSSETSNIAVTINRGSVIYYQEVL